MSFNGSGLFQVNTAGQPVVSGTAIDPTVFNNLTADLATGLSTCITKDGQTTVTANIPMGSNKITGLAAGTARTDAANLGNVQDGTGVYVGTVGGTADVITLTPSPAIASYTAGQTFRFIASGANTTNVTVNVSGLGAKAITKNGTTALVAGDIPASTIVEITYDGTRFILGTTGTQINDSVFRISGSADATKKLAFEVDGITTGTTRTITVPDADLTLPAVTAKGDIPIATASGVLSKIAVGSNGTILMARSADSSGLAYVAALSKAIYGFTYAINGSDASNDIDFAVGGAMDSTGAYWLTGNALTKQLDAAWAVGTNAGMLDTGAVGNNDYYLWVIGRSDTGVVDYLASLSSTTPTMPASYDFKRLIGWLKRSAGANVAFTTYETEGGGLEFLWSSPTVEVNLTNTLATARRTDALKVPLNFSVTAHINVSTDDSSGGYIRITSPDQTDVAPSGSVAPLSTFRCLPTNQTYYLSVRTSSTGTVASRANVTVDTYIIATEGFSWSRRI